MRRKLALVAAAGFGISVVCLGAAFAIGGRALANAPFYLGPLARCALTGDGAAASRALDWNSGDDQAVVALPANVHYRAGSGQQVILKGPAALLGHVRIKDGVVELDCQPPHNFSAGNIDRLDVTLPGAHRFRDFGLRGSGDMDLEGLDQPAANIDLRGSGTVKTQGTTGTLEVSIRGTGTVQGTGKADTLSVDIRGMGNVQLADLPARDVKIDVRGNGKVAVAPQDLLKVDIRGSGTVTLNSEPRNISTDIRGNGSIVHTDGRVEHVHGTHQESGGN